MKESLFLKAEKLKNKIQQVETFIEKYKSNNLSKICICCDEYYQTVNIYTNGIYSPSNSGMAPTTYPLPKELEPHIIEYLESKLEEYKKEFSEL